MKFPNKIFLHIKELKEGGACIEHETLVSCPGAHKVMF